MREIVRANRQPQLQRFSLLRVEYDEDRTC